MHEQRANHTGGKGKLCWRREYACYTDHKVIITKLSGKGWGRAEKDEEGKVRNN